MAQNLPASFVLLWNDSNDNNANNKIYYNDIKFHTFITFPCFFSFPQFSFIPYWLYFWLLSSFYPGAHLMAFISGFTLGSGLSELGGPLLF